MSKHILLNEKVMNLITTQLLGEDIQYSLRPTKWFNGKKLDGLYTFDDSNVSPPVLIKVQNVVNDAFLHHLVGYCGKIYEEYESMPVILVIVIGKINNTILYKTTKDDIHPFLVKLPCFPWAKRCFLISTESMQEYLAETPLSPLVALGIYFTSQETSVLDHSHADDPTIEMLYNISQKIYESNTANENTGVNDLLSLCQKSEAKIKEGMNVLEELIEETNKKKRVLDCLNESIEIIKSYRIKYMPTASPPASPRLSVSSLGSSSVSSPVPSSSTVPASKNWVFIRDYIQNLGKERMNWNLCFEECQRQGVLLNYTKAATLKSGYQRWKSQSRFM